MVQRNYGILIVLESCNVQTRSANRAAEARTKVTENTYIWVVGAASLRDCVVTQPVPVVEVTVVRNEVGVIVN